MMPINLKMVKLYARAAEHIGRHLWGPPGRSTGSRYPCSLAGELHVRADPSPGGLQRAALRRGRAKSPEQGEASPKTGARWDGGLGSRGEADGAGGRTGRPHTRLGPGTLPCRLGVWQGTDPSTGRS